MLKQAVANERIREFLNDNPSPSDEQVHDLAEELDMEPDKLEEQIYDMLSQFVVSDDDKIPGGLADDKSVDDFPKDQIEKGIEVELEHTDDPEIAREISMDHLTESDDYYSRLDGMESEMKGKQGRKRVVGVGMSRREYKSRDQLVRKNLERHNSRMQELMSQGMSKEDASKQAYKEIMDESYKKGKVSDEAQDWISRKIKKLVNEGKDQDQAVAIAYSMARDKGYDVPEKKGARIMDVYALFIGDGYLAGATTNPAGSNERYWPMEMRSEDDWQIVKIKGVPSDLAADLETMGTGRQQFRDGYEAANAVADYKRIVVDSANEKQASRLDPWALVKIAQEPVAQGGQVQGQEQVQKGGEVKGGLMGLFDRIDTAGIDALAGEMKFNSWDEFANYVAGLGDVGSKFYEITEKAVKSKQAAKDQFLQDVKLGLAYLTAANDTSLLRSLSYMIPVVGQVMAVKDLVELVAKAPARSRDAMRIMAYLTKNLPADAYPTLQRVWDVMAKRLGKWRVSGEAGQGQEQAAPGAPVQASRDPWAKVADYGHNLVVRWPNGEYEGFRGFGSGEKVAIENAKRKVILKAREMGVGEPEFLSYDDYEALDADTKDLIKADWVLSRQAFPNAGEGSITASRDPWAIVRPQRKQAGSFINFMNTVFPGVPLWSIAKWFSDKKDKKEIAETIQRQLPGPSGELAAKQFMNVAPDQLTGQMLVQMYRQNQGQGGQVTKTPDGGYDVTVPNRGVQARRKQAQWSNLAPAIGYGMQAAITSVRTLLATYPSLKWALLMTLPALITGEAPVQTTAPPPRRKERRAASDNKNILQTLGDAVSHIPGGNTFIDLAAAFVPGGLLLVFLTELYKVLKADPELSQAGQGQDSKGGFDWMGKLKNIDLSSGPIVDYPAGPYVGEGGMGKFDSDTDVWFDSLVNALESGQAKGWDEVKRIVRGRPTKDAVNELLQALQVASPGRVAGQIADQAEKVLNRGYRDEFRRQTGDVSQIGSLFSAIRQALDYGPSEGETMLREGVLAKRNEREFVTRFIEKNASRVWSAVARERQGDIADMNAVLKKADTSVEQILNRDGLNALLKLSERYIFGVTLGETALDLFKDEIGREVMGYRRSDAMDPDGMPGQVLNRARHDLQSRKEKGPLSSDDREELNILDEHAKMTGETPDDIVKPRGKQAFRSKRHLRPQFGQGGMGKDFRSLIGESLELYDIMESITPQNIRSVLVNNVEEVLKREMGSAWRDYSVVVPVGAEHEELVEDDTLSIGGDFEVFDGTGNNILAYGTVYGDGIDLGDGGGELSSITVEITEVPDEGGMGRGADEGSANELLLWIDNDESLYNERMRIEKQLIDSGNMDSVRAKWKFRPLVGNAASMARLQSRGSGFTFNEATRNLAVQMLVDELKESVARGEHASQVEQGGMGERHDFVSTEEAFAFFDDISQDIEDVGSKRFLLDALASHAKYHLGLSFEEGKVLAEEWMEGKGGRGKRPFGDSALR